MSFGAMRTYKVSFNNGNAVSAEVVDPALYADIKKFSFGSNSNYIEWYLIECDNETEAIETADKVVKSIWGEYLAK